MTVNIFDLAGYMPNLFQYQSLNIFSSLETILSEVPDKDWNNSIFHTDPEAPKPWVEYYRQSAINGELLAIDDLV